MSKWCQTACKQSIWRNFMQKLIYNMSDVKTNEYGKCDKHDCTYGMPQFYFSNVLLCSWLYEVLANLRQSLEWYDRAWPVVHHAILQGSPSVAGYSLMKNYTRIVSLNLFCYHDGNLTCSAGQDFTANLRNESALWGKKNIKRTYM